MLVWHAHNCCKLFCFKEIQDDDLATNIICDLVQKLPTHHRATLIFLLQHLCHVCQLQEEFNLSDPLSKICYAFCHVLMRPSWENIGWVCFGMLTETFWSVFLCKSVFVCIEKHSRSHDPTDDFPLSTSIEINQDWAIEKFTILPWAWFDISEA